MAFDLDNYGTSKIFSWDHNYLVKVLTTGHNRIVKSPRLVQALKLIKREDFIPEENRHLAYTDKVIDIGYGQNILQPTITAFMLELMNPKAGGRVLDIGTGSGWTTALIAHMVGENGKVITVERNQYLLSQARENIEKYEMIKNIEYIFRDGINGVPERAPYDGIHISFALDEVPEIIKSQLNVGGRLVVPLNKQRIKLIQRESKDHWKESLHEGIVLDQMVEGVS